MHVDHFSEAQTSTAIVDTGTIPWFGRHWLLVVCIQRFVHDQLALGLFIGRNQFQVKGMWFFFIHVQ